MTELSPREIVSELDRFIIGQQAAKKAVAIALRNRYRRLKVDEHLRDEIVPKNILMIGPTGVGKTEISRRLAKLANAPFVKVEATKFTEVGYVGRDVESIIRDLLEVGIALTRTQMRKDVTARAELAAEERLLDALIGEDAREETRTKFRKMLRNDELKDKEIEIATKDGSGSMPLLDIPGMPGSQIGMLNLGDIMNKTFGGTPLKKRKMTVSEAFEALLAEESDKLLDEDKVTRTAIHTVENNGIVFIDEIDKITARSDYKGGADVSREGVQRDLLPLLEGTVVPTKYGAIRTDHILFIASGAFHLAKPSDLLPELQGRLPIRVQLDALSEEDLVRILTEPEASLTKQYAALMEVEKVKVEFSEDGIREIAKIAADVNQNVENIGARRLHTVIEKLFEEISYRASDMKRGEVVRVNAPYVKKQLSEITDPQDLSRFIL